MTCVLWTKARTSKGYGQAWDPELKKVIYVHRKAWQDAHGEIPVGMLVCHHCDTPQCVNVEHLFLGTAQDNSNDMIRKGRSGGRPLSVEECEVILTSPLSTRKLATAFGVSRYRIDKVRSVG